ncbi:MAG: hypothetical protein JKY54_19265 [Flavobacteriales bacterium]|nr:hypothetical protein [Flavobacteriales bacterium]
MELQLKYSPSKLSNRIDGFYVRGENMMACLKTLKDIDISDDPKMYPVPISLSDTTFSGILVIADNLKTSSQSIKGIVPLQKIGARLYLPIGAESYPPTSADELNKSLLYEIQLFLPTERLIGFDRSDLVDISSLLTPLLRNSKDWGYAKAGVTELPEIQQVSLKPMTEKELIKQMESTVDKKPLTEIPTIDAKPKKTKVAKSFESMKRKVLKGSLKLINAVPASTANFNNAPGFLDRMENWLTNQMENLENERDTELNRLMDLFDKDADEALKYAIPLASNYMNRGEARPGSKLGRRSTNFNLTGLGGGAFTDTWNVDSYYDRLRSKYLKSADEAVKEGDHKKAAYVHANLLGDYHSAARVLRDGHCYLEAATLYKEHLKDKNMASECYEEGKLYKEAIDIQLEFEAFEKVGDLYQKMNNAKKSDHFYDKASGEYIKRNSFYEASQIAKDKQNNPEKAQEWLLEGWNGGNNSQKCLENYFFDFNEDEGQELAKEVTKIYENEVPSGKGMKFLNVLESLNERNEKQRSNNLQIAHEILSKEAGKGNVGSLKKLNAFLPNDRFISSDVSRFVSSSVNFKIKEAKNAKVQLRESISWIRMINCGRDLLLFGMEKGGLFLARVNGYGNIDYITCPGTPFGDQHIHLISDPLIHDKAILFSDDLANLGNYGFEKNKYFGDGLTVYQTKWLPNGTIACCMSKNGLIASIDVMHGKLILREHSLQGKILDTNQCTSSDENGEQATVEINGDQDAQAFYWRNDVYHLIMDGMYYRIQSNGNLVFLPSVHAVLAQPSNFAKDNWIAMVTYDEDIVLIKEGESQQGKEVYLNDIGSDNFNSIIWVNQNKILFSTSTKIFERDTAAIDLKEVLIRTSKANIVKMVAGPNANQISILDDKGGIELVSVS